MSVSEQRYLNPHHVEEEDLDYVSNYTRRRLKRNITLCVLYCSLLAAGVIILMLLQGGGQQQVQSTSIHKVMHVTDSHVDIFFDPEESAPRGGCHSCALAMYSSSSSSSPSFSSTNSSSFKCPSERDIMLHIANNGTSKISSSGQQGRYLFGRYGCDPPLLLWSSLLGAMSQIDSSPPVVVFTGDISPHTYPDDDYVITEHTTIEDLCLTKFYVTKILLQQLVSTFPGTHWAFAIGNNDHFPKNVYWQPYIDLLGDMMLEIGFFTQHQHDQFIAFGSNFIDVQGVRYVSLDMTLFVPEGEVFGGGVDTGEGEHTHIHRDRDRDRDSEKKSEKERSSSVVPRLLLWLEATLEEAADKNLAVYFVGHQPLSTRFGTDELDIGSPHFMQLKEIITKHAAIIRVGLFGHHNIQSLVQVLSPGGEVKEEQEQEQEEGQEEEEEEKDEGASPRAIFPAIIAAGVSPRAPNQPSFNVLYKSAASGVIIDFQQHSLDLQEANRAASSSQQPHGKEQEQEEQEEGASRVWAASGLSWAALSGEKNFTAPALDSFLCRLAPSCSSSSALSSPSCPSPFLSLQALERGGYFGKATPELLVCRASHDRAEDMARCLFPRQDMQCWDPDYWVTTG